MKSALIAALVATVVGAGSAGAASWINGHSIRPHSIPLNRLVRVPTGSVGPVGPQGPQGLQGTPGQSPSIVKKVTTVSVGSGYAAPSAPCPNSYKAVGGGFLADPPLIVQASLPAQDLSDWETWVYNPSNSSAYVTVYAICLASG